MFGMTYKEPDDVMHDLEESAKEGITSLVGVLSSSLTINGKVGRMRRIADDLINAAQEADDV